MEHNNTKTTIKYAIKFYGKRGKIAYSIEKDNLKDLLKLRVRYGHLRTGIIVRRITFEEEYLGV